MTRRAHGQVRLGELVHFRFELGEVFRRERPAEREVVVEAVFDDRTDRDLRFRIDRLHGLRKQVRGRVPQDLETVRVLAGDDGQRGVAIDQVRCIDELAVDAAGKRGLRQTRANARSDLRHGDRTRRNCADCRLAV